MVFVFRRTWSRSTIATVVRHDFETNITVGFIFSDAQARIHHALLGIPQQFRILAHPLLVPFLIGEHMLAEASIIQDVIDEDIIDIEKATGFNNYALTTSNIGLQDYRQLSKKLGYSASFFAYQKARLLALEATHKFCSQQLISWQSWIPKDKWEIYTEPTRILLERAEYTASQIGHALLYRGLEMRLQVQQNVVSINTVSVVFGWY